MTHLSSYDRPKFTLGPWQVAPHSDRDERVDIIADYHEHPNGIKQAHWIAECDSGYDPETDDSEESLATMNANARLIAKSPELREALMNLVNVIDKAGLLNLSNGVQLGATSWYVKASDALTYAKRVLSEVDTEQSVENASVSGVTGTTSPQDSKKIDEGSDDRS